MPVTKRYEAIPISLLGTNYDLKVGNIVEEYVITGVGALTANWAIAPSGVPVEGMTCRFRYQGNVTQTIAETITILGTQFPLEYFTKQCVITARYTTATWEVKIMPDFEEDDIIQQSHLDDDSVGTNEIIDNNVTLAKMDGIARGSVIYGDAAGPGDPAYLTVGTNAQMLISDGTDFAWTTIGGDATITNAGVITVTDSPTNTLQEVFDEGLAATIVPITVADTENARLVFTQNDVTNNPDAIHIINAGTGDCLQLTPSASSVAINIDAGTTDHTAGNVMFMNVDVNSANVNALAFDIDVGTALSAGETVNGIFIDIDGLAGDNAGSFMNAISITSAGNTGGTNTGLLFSGMSFDYCINMAGVAINDAGILMNSATMNIGIDMSAAICNTGIDMNTSVITTGIDMGAMTATTLIDLSGSIATTGIDLTGVGSTTCINMTGLAATTTGIDMTGSTITNDIILGNGAIIHNTSATVLTVTEASTIFVGNTLTRGLLAKQQPTPTAETVAATLTAAKLLTFIITATHNVGATQAYTLDTGANMDVALPYFANDDSFEFTVINLSAAALDTITLTGAAGFTIVGNPIIASANAARIDNSSGTFRARRTAANTWVAYRV